MGVNNSGKNDDFRRQHLDDFSGTADVYMMDTSLETVLYGKNVSPQSGVVDVSVPRVKRSY